MGEKVEELKQVELKNGKFTLEGKVVEAELKSLKVISYPEHIGEMEMYDRFGSNCLNMSIDDVFEKDIVEGKPNGVNAYVLGKKHGNSFWATLCYPVLYLKINEEK